MVFPVVRYGCDRWTLKKAEYQRIEAFELWCWRRLLRVSWTAGNSNWSILKEINPEYLLEELLLKLKLQYFGHLMQRADLLEKTLMLRKIEGRSQRWWQRMRPLDSITDSIDISLSDGDGEALGDGEEQGSLVRCCPWVHRVRPDWATEKQHNQRLEHSQWSRIDVFWNSLAFSIIQQMLTIWSLVPLSFLNPGFTSASSQITYCWSLAWRILNITLLAYEKSTLVW